MPLHAGVHGCPRWRGQPVDHTHPANECSCRPAPGSGPVLLLTRQHEPTDQCMPYHCAYHHVDEVDDRKGGRSSYLACGECFHLYKTPGELRQAHRRLWREMARTAPWFDDPAWREGKLRTWWRLLFVRASQIHSCPFCSHDF